MANFIMRRNNVRLQGGDTRLFPQIERTGIVKINEIAQNISEGTTFTPGDIKGVISALSREIAACCARGKSVTIEGLGTFRARLGVRNEENTEHEGDTSKRNRASVYVKGLYVNASKDLVAMTDKLSNLTRTDTKAEAPAEPLDYEERVEKLREYLTRNAFINCAAYAKLSGLSKTSATKELHALSLQADTFLAKQGKASHTIYVLKK